MRAGPRVLTLRQPWASAIFAARGRKNVENRTWPTHHRGLLYIHAAGRPDRDARSSVWRTAGDDPPLGAIIGHVELTAVTFDVEHPNKWAANNMWHWWMYDPVLLEEPIYCSGQQSLWRVPPSLWRYLDEEGQRWIEDE